MRIPARRFRPIAVLMLAGALLPAGAESLFLRYRLPALTRVPATDTTVLDLLRQARAPRLMDAAPVSFGEIEDPAAYEERLRETIEAGLPAWPDAATPQVFTGDRTSRLNELIARASTPGQPALIRVAAPELIGDEALTLRAGVFLDATGARLVSAPGNAPAHAVRAGPDVTGAGVRGLRIDAPTLGVLVDGARGLRLEALTIDGGGRGIAVMEGSRHIDIEGARISAPGHGGILIQGGTSHIRIRHSRISGGLSARNGAAAILLTNARSALPSDIESLTSHQALAQSIWPPAPAPHRILIEYNQLEGNRAQGLYLDGASGVAVLGNVVRDNDKEGVCLDFGAVNNLVEDNVVRGNGHRARQSDGDLEEDLVLGFGRLADGSSVAKLPGISLDNAAGNIVLRNVIHDNGGDGIKIVRSGFRNLFLFNSITDNNRGHNSRFHFFGILLGSAGLEPELDPSTEHPLDFLPSVENMAAGNSIYGKHHAGILLDHDAAYNDLFDNLVRHQVHAPLESASTRFNSVVGNDWNAPPKARPWWRFWN